RSISSARSQSRANGASSRSQNSRADERTSSCSGVSVKSMKRGGAGEPAPASSASLDQVAELGPAAVLVTDQPHLRDREPIARARLDLDALERVRIDPVHLPCRVHQ